MPCSALAYVSSSTIILFHQLILLTRLLATSLTLPIDRSDLQLVVLAGSHAVAPGVKELLEPQGLFCWHFSS